MGNILVYTNHEGSQLTSNAIEALSFGGKIAQSLGKELESITVGESVQHAAKEAISYGATKVYTVEDTLLNNYQPDLYVDAVSTAIQQADADIIIFPFDRQGKDLVGRIAKRIDAASLTEVVDFVYEENSLRWIRPIYGEKALGEYTSNRDKIIIGIRPSTHEKGQADESRTGDIIAVSPTLNTDLVITKVVETIASSLSGIRLEDAKVIVAGGRGLEGPEGFEQLKELAEVLGGTIGATRAACDAGWVSSELQIGQTGAIVAPDLYIAVGISGAGQHLSGIANAKTVVAINTDEEAAIFKRANFGIIGDYKEIIPQLTETLKKKLNVGV